MLQIFCAVHFNLLVWRGFVDLSFLRHLRVFKQKLQQNPFARLENRFCCSHQVKDFPAFTHVQSFITFSQFEQFYAVLFVASTLISSLVEQSDSSKASQCLPQRSDGWNSPRRPVAHRAVTCDVPFLCQAALMRIDSHLKVGNFLNRRK